ncbi:P-loop containing nucleoside triphosphate hydrolase protein, partial [Ochromonadaceae sp. CCMP2298]
MADKRGDESIQVVVRCRPLNDSEKEMGCKSIVDVDVEARRVTIRNPDNATDTRYFTFNASYGQDTEQRTFYDESCFSVIEGALAGFNSTIFAYGQTGSGKSFTMQGASTTAPDLTSMGVIPNSFSHIFRFIKASKDTHFTISCSYLELYNEEIRDLLSDHKNSSKPSLKSPSLDLGEDPNKSVYVKGLTHVVCESAEDLNKMLDKGLASRTTACTLMNAESSRSHSIFTIIVEMSTTDATGEVWRTGKLNLVDLAGSETQKKTGATGAALQEGININLSLSALGNVITALTSSNRPHIPYRDSKLTRLLRESLGGNSKTVMIATVSPADYNYQETLSTLRYAQRAKKIKNQPKINEDPKDVMLRESKEEIQRLRGMLSQ